MQSDAARGGLWAEALRPARAHRHAGLLPLITVDAGSLKPPLPGRGGGVRRSHTGGARYVVDRPPARLVADVPSIRKSLDLRLPLRRAVPDPHFAFEPLELGRGLTSMQQQG
jgi:hypothetical protein